MSTALAAVDLGSADDPGRVWSARAVEVHGRVDVLVNNMGGVRLRLNGFLDTSDEEFEWAMRMNFFSAVRATRAAVAHMLEQGGGAIVSVASVNAFFQPDGGTIDYGAAKAALVNFTKALSEELGPRHIRVNAVSPGPVSTDLWLGEVGVAHSVARAMGVDADTARERVIAGIGGFATGRFSTPEEVATLVVMLASERTGNVTGANYVIDGERVVYLRVGFKIDRQRIQRRPSSKRAPRRKFSTARFPSWHSTGNIRASVIRKDHSAIHGVAHVSGSSTVTR